jgi:hypothetical protein
MILPKPSIVVALNSKNFRATPSRIGMGVFSTRRGCGKRGKKLLMCFTSDFLAIARLCDDEAMHMGYGDNGIDTSAYLNMELSPPPHYSLYRK